MVRHCVILSRDLRTKQGYRYAMVAKSQHGLAVILHADVVGSTALVRKDQQIGHDRIQIAFQGFSKSVRTDHVPFSEQADIEWGVAGLRIAGLPE